MSDSAIEQGYGHIERQRLIAIRVELSVETLWDETVVVAAESRLQRKSGPVARAGHVNALFESVEPGLFCLQIGALSQCPGNQIPEIGVLGDVQALEPRRHELVTLDRVQLQRAHQVHFTELRGILR